MVNDITNNFNRQPIKHVVRSRKARRMFCDCCNPARTLVWHAELYKICCPATGRVPKVLEENQAVLDKLAEPGTEDRPTIVTADGFQSGGTPTNLSSLKMRAKFGPRAYTTINKEEFPDIDQDTKEMLERNPSFRLVDYRVNDPE